MLETSVILCYTSKQRMTAQFGGNVRLRVYFLSNFAEFYPL